MKVVLNPDKWSLSDPSLLPSSSFFVSPNQIIFCAPTLSSLEVQFYLKSSAGLFLYWFSTAKVVTVWSARKSYRVIAQIRIIFFFFRNVPRQMVTRFLVQGEEGVVFPYFLPLPHAIRSAQRKAQRGEEGGRGKSEGMWHSRNANSACAPPPPPWHQIHFLRNCEAGFHRE